MCELVYAKDQPLQPDGPNSDAEVTPLVASYAADDVALAALTRSQAPEALFCHACDVRIEGAPTASGLFVWARGDVIHTEEPPLCEACATAIGLTALRRWQLEDEEG